MRFSAQLLLFDIWSVGLNTTTQILNFKVLDFLKSNPIQYLVFTENIKLLHHIQYAEKPNSSQNVSPNQFNLIFFHLLPGRVLTVSLTKFQ